MEPLDPEAKKLTGNLLKAEGVATNDGPGWDGVEHQVEQLIAFGEDQEQADPEEVQQGFVSLHHSQMVFFLAIAKIVVAVAGIRGGKTHAGAFKTIMYAIQNKCSVDEMHLVCSPTYQMSKVPVEKIFKLLYDKDIFPICPLIKFIKSDRTFILAAAGGGITRIRVVSLHDPNKIRGIKALSAWIDEGAYVTQEAWDVVQGRLADSDGPCWITTTPAGYNFIYDLYIKAVEERRAGVPLNERQIRFVHWRSTANTFVAKSGFERLSASLDARTHMQEIEAKFVKMAGLVYHAFSRQRNIVAQPIDRRKQLYIGQDFNVSMMASSFSQPIGKPMKDRNHSGIHIVHERLAPDSNTADMVNYVDRFISEHGIPRNNVTFYPDASAAQRSTAGKSDLQIIREARYVVRASGKNPFVKDRINCVNGLLAPRVGPPRLLVDPSCKKHIFSFTQQIYKPDSDPPEPDKEHGLDHIMDANGYTCWRKFPLRVKASLGLTTAQIAAWRNNGNR